MYVCIYIYMKSLFSEDSKAVFTSTDIDVYDGEYRVDSSTLEVVVVVTLLDGKCGRAGSMVELYT